MADLNKVMSEVQKDSAELEKKLKNLHMKYETLYKEGYRIYTTERIAVGSMEGLESFHRLIQTVRRNKDVIGSLLRGHNNLRSLADFKFVEEEIPVEKPKPKKARKRPKPQPMETYNAELAASEEVDG